jgi:hypothetical protein
MLEGGDFSAVNLFPDLRVMAYVAAVSVGAGLVFGLSPSLHFTRHDIHAALKTEGASLGQLHGARLRNLWSVLKWPSPCCCWPPPGSWPGACYDPSRREPGFATRDVFLVLGNIPGFVKETSGGRGVTAILDSLRHTTEWVAAQGHAPFGGTWTPPIFVEGLSSRMLASYASDGYFNLLRIPVLRGRDFTRQEAAGLPVALISESTARRFWPGQDPLGKSFTLDWDFRGHLAKFEVIGVAKDIRFANLTRIDPAHVYLPAGASAGFSAVSQSPQILVRFQGRRQQALAAVEAALAPLDKHWVPHPSLVNLEEGVVSTQRAMVRAFAIFAAILAGLAIALAGVGIYGVVGYVVSLSTREIGIRMALGASRRALLNDVVLAGLQPVFVGSILGLGAATALSGVWHTRPWSSRDRRISCTACRSTTRPRS